MLGIIGGSGIYRLPGLEDEGEVTATTPFGNPSGSIRRGRIGGTKVAFIARHGVGHRRSPSYVPYRANLYALKELGVTHLLSVSAVGSLREELPPRTLVIPDQIVDRTVARERTFFDGSVVAHVGIADPFCQKFRESVIEAAGRGERVKSDAATYVCIEGPQFSTRAESNLYRSWGGSVIGMTAQPEARLAREAELCYAMLALVTDYDVWHDRAEDVSVEVVVGHLRAASATAAEAIARLAGSALPERTCGCSRALDGAIMSDPELIEADAWDRLGVIGHRVRPVSAR